MREGQWFGRGDEISQESYHDGKCPMDKPGGRKMPLPPNIKTNIKTEMEIKEEQGHRPRFTAAPP